jgi:hypothetical protein
LKPDILIFTLNLCLQKIDGAVRFAAVREDMPLVQPENNARLEYGAPDRIFQVIALKFLIRLRWYHVNGCRSL